MPQNINDSPSTLFTTVLRQQGVSQKTKVKPGGLSKLGKPLTHIWLTKFLIKGISTEKTPSKWETMWAS